MKTIFALAALTVVAFVSASQAGSCNTTCNWVGDYQYCHTTCY